MTTKTMARIGLSVVTGGLWAIGAAGPALGANFVVNRAGDAPDLNLANAVCDVSTNNGNQCTLRAAIQEANDTPGPDVINFNITAGSGAVKVIAPGTLLPDITDPVTIDGYTQPTSSTNTQITGSNAVLRIVLDGINAGGFAGLRIETNDSVVRGLVIQRFGPAGVAVRGDNNVISGNFIGTNAAGTTARDNGDGIVVHSGTGNRIGGTTLGARNLISGNDGYGIGIEGNQVEQMLVQGNLIGTTRAGDAALANRLQGIYISEATGTTIGGTVAGARNVISGNGSDGIQVDDEANGDPIVIQGNYIGVDAGGGGALGNGRHGISVSELAVTIGGPSAAARNVISANAASGLFLSGIDGSSVVQGNYIGTNATGTADLGNNQSGITINSSDVQVGGTAAGERNVLSGNGMHGIHILGGGSSIVQGNRIGTRASGTGDLGNDGDGVFLENTGSTVGGLVAGAGNLIFGNGQHGIEAERGPQTILGNVINANSLDGVRVLATATGVRVTGNQIFGNGRRGIDLVGGAENPLGVTANDIDDPDTGANGLQNFPVLISAVRNPSTGVTVVRGRLNSTPGILFQIQIFVSDSDPSTHGEARRLVISRNVTTNSNGDVEFTSQTSQVTAKDLSLTATATRLPGNHTSEFSLNRPITQP